MSVAAGSIEVHHSALLQWYKLQQQDKDTSGLAFQFNIEGIHFVCVYDAVVSPDHVCIRCDVFDLAVGREASLLKLLLQDNCHRHQQGMPIFSMDVEQGRVMALWNMCLLSSTPSAFAVQLHRWVHDVKQWQHISVSEVHEPQGGRRAQ